MDESLFGKQGEDFKRGSLDNLQEERQFRGEDTSTPTLTAAVPNNSKSPKILYNSTTNWKTMELYLGLRFSFLSNLQTRASQLVSQTLLPRYLVRVAMGIRRERVMGKAARQEAFLR